MRITLGIDLGTTNSSCAFMENDEPRIIPNDRGNRITPSIVAFTDKGILVGEAAKNQGVINTERTVRSVKRFMGKEENLIIGGSRHTPEEISSLILAKLKRDSETFLGQNLVDAVITVPAYFNEKQRRATKEAGRLAGFNVKRILNEPTAAALAGAYNQKGDRNILVYDLGGGTFDVTYLLKRDKDFIVRASGGDNHLGGDDFDALLLKEVVSVFSEKSGYDIKRDPVLMEQLRELVERAKIELSSRESASISLPFFSQGSRPIHLNYQVDRKEFNWLIRPLIQRTLDITLDTLKEGGANPKDLECLIFSGGSSRIPLVHSLLYDELGLKAEARINPEEVVAAGAAVSASLLDKQRDYTLRDVTSFSLGVEIEQGKFVKILKKNQPIPAKASRTFTTISDNQQSVEIHVLQGEEEESVKNSSLGRFLLSGIRQGLRGEPQIEISFNLDEDGIVQVTARDLDTGVSQKVSLMEEGEEKGQAAKVEILIRRVREKLGEDLPLEESFREEISQILAKADKILKGGDKNRLPEFHLALETILLELREYEEQERVEYEGA